MNETHHYLWIALAFSALGLITYIVTINRPDQESFGRGSFKIEQHRQDWPLSFHLGEGGCTRLDSLKALKDTKK